MEIIGTDKFYIGKTIGNLENYWGSGGDWNKYIDENKISRDNDHIKKVIIKDSGFKSHKDLYAFEAKEIQKYCYDQDGEFLIKDEYKGKLLNYYTKEQWSGLQLRCPECGHTPHLKTCSRIKMCKECKGKTVIINLGVQKVSNVIYVGELMDTIKEVVLSIMIAFYTAQCHTKQVVQMRKNVKNVVE